MEDAVHTVDLHMHTVFSDGADSVEDMVQTGIRLGLGTMGISDHVYTPFDPSYSSGMADVRAYQHEVRAVAQRVAGQIEVRCGVEQDFYAGRVAPGFDYAIGSVHYVAVPDDCNHDEAIAAGGFLCEDGVTCIVPVDDSEETFVRVCERCFGGDYYAFAEAFFAHEAQVLEVTGADYVGHFDLIALYNGATGENRYFDEAHPRYIAAWQAAADALIAHGAVFEVNAAALVRGRRDVAYPAPDIRRYLLQRGTRFVYNGDSHSVGMLARTHAALGEIQRCAER